MKNLVVVLFVYMAIGMAEGNRAVKLIIAEPGETCDALCQKYEMKCVAGGFAGVDVKQKFESLGFPCKSQQVYWARDQPCYAFSRSHCYGTTKLPAQINCGAGGNRAVRRLCPCASIKYVMAEPGENCYSQCGKLDMKCVEEGFQGVDVKQKFESLGFPCRTQQVYWARDQPCYAYSRQHCYGTTKVPDKIKCGAGGNRAVRRLCPCSC